MIVAAAEGDRAPVFKIRSAAIHQPVADAKLRSINPPEPAAADGRGDFKIALVAVLFNERIDDLIFTHGMGAGPFFVPCFFVMRPASCSFAAGGPDASEQIQGVSGRAKAS